jgi:lipoprotein-releasing system permease protein
MLEALVGVRYLLDVRRSYVVRLFLLFGLLLMVHGAGITFFMPNASPLLGLIGLLTFIAGVLVAYVCTLGLYLSVYTVISIVGGTLGVAALTTVLSVMSGFEQDLKLKILGANAHVVVRKAGGGDIQAKDEIWSLLRDSKDVQGSSPFVQDEVIATSPTGLTGVLIKGIDTDTIGEVSDLADDIPKGQGGLDYLIDPSKITRDFRPPVFTSFSLPSSFPGSEPTSSPLDLPGRGPAALPPSSFDELPAPLRPGRPPYDDPFAPGGEPAPFEEIIVPGPPPPLPVVSKPLRKLPGVILGKQLAEETLHVNVGDEIELVTPWGDLGPTGPIPKSRSFRVAGVFYSGMYELDARVIYLTLPEAQKFLLLDKAVTGFEVRVRDFNQAGAVADEINQRLKAIEGGPYEAVPWQELNKSLFSALKVEKQMMFLVLVVIIIVAAFFIVSSLLMVVLRKGKEIAIMKSMGASDGMILRVFMVAGSFIGVTGTACGTIGGYGLCRLIELRGVPIPADVYYISRLPVLIQPLEFLMVGGAALVISLLATLYPSRLASKLTPIEGLRL